MPPARAGASGPALGVGGHGDLPVGKAANAGPAGGRRPADLADHLRESRPADLSDYTSGKIPRMRRPVEETPPPVRRPATLADHLSARGPGEEATRDLRDHAAKE
jgi:hypothetical protein